MLALRPSIRIFYPISFVVEEFVKGVDAAFRSFDHTRQEVFELLQEIVFFAHPQ